MVEDKEEGYESERYEAMQDSYNTIAFRLDPTPTIEEIRRYLLKNTLFNQEKNSWQRPKDIKPIFIEEGIEDLMLEIRGRMSVDKVLSVLKDNEIRRFIRELGEVIIEFIFFNEDKYEIQEADFTRIYMIVIHNVEIFLRRALKTTHGGTENVLLTKGLSHREVVRRTAGTQEEQESRDSSGYGLWGKK